MKLTFEELSKYVGGQMEIQNPEISLFRGQIKSATVKDDELQVQFAWLARDEGYPGRPTRWVRDAHLDNERFFLHIDKFWSTEDRTLIINCSYTGERAILFLPDRRLLDSSEITGF